MYNIKLSSFYIFINIYNFLKSDTSRYSASDIDVDEPSSRLTIQVNLIITHTNKIIIKMLEATQIMFFLFMLEPYRLSKQ